MCRLIRRPTPQPQQTQKSEAIPVPLIKQSIAAQIVDLAATVTIKQLYINKEDSPIETEFIFPLDDPKAAVSAFEAVIGDQKVVGKVKTKEDAADAYDDAISSGHSAVLLEAQQGKEATFKASIGNLGPGQSCELSISYITQLGHKDTRTLLTIPKSLFPDPAELLGWLNAKGGGVTLQDFSLEVIIDMPSPVVGLESPTHPVSMEFDGGHAQVTLIPKAHEKSLDVDFQLLVKQKDGNQARGWVEIIDGKPAAAMVCMHPTFDRKIVPEIIFLVDRSGSMRKEQRMESAKNALKLFLRGLPAGSYFNIFSFGTRHSSLWSSSQPYDDKTLQRATEHIESMAANMQETNLVGPLKQIFESEPRSGCDRQLFILTDGAVPNTPAVTNLVKEHVLHTRVFTVGLGAGVSYFLVRELARLGNGTAEFCQHGERLETKIMRQLKLAICPSFYNCELEWGNLRENQVQKAPHLPTLFRGDALVALALFPTGKLPEKVKFTAEDPDGSPVVCEVTLQAMKESNTPFISLLAARQIIASLEAQTSPSSADVRLFPPAAKIKEQVVELALKYQQASKYTSFVAVRENEEQTLGSMKKRTITAGGQQQQQQQQQRPQQQAVTQPVKPQQVQPAATISRPTARISSVAPSRGRGGSVVNRSAAPRREQVQEMARSRSGVSYAAQEELLEKKACLSETRVCLSEVSESLSNGSAPAPASPGIFATIASYFSPSVGSAPASPTSDLASYSPQSQSPRSYDSWDYGDSKFSSSSSATSASWEDSEKVSVKCEEAEWGGERDSEELCKKSVKNKKTQKRRGKAETKLDRKDKKDKEKEKEQSKGKGAPKPKSEKEGIPTSVSEGRRQSGVVYNEATFQQLAFLQKAMGFWTLDSQVLRIVGGWTEKEIAAAFEGGVSQEVMVTVLAVLVFKHKFESLKDDWEMLVMKAEGWLLSQAKDDEDLVASWMDKGASIVA